MWRNKTISKSKNFDNLALKDTVLANTDQHMKSDGFYPVQLDMLNDDTVSIIKQAYVRRAYPWTFCPLSPI